MGAITYINVFGRKVPDYVFMGYTFAAIGAGFWVKAKLTPAAPKPLPSFSADEEKSFVEKYVESGMAKYKSHGAQH